MNNQQLAGYGGNITPFRAVVPDANFVLLQPKGFGVTGPSFAVSVGEFVPAAAAIPGKPAVPQQSGPNLPDYVPAQEAVPEVPAVPTQFNPHRSLGELVLTQEEWDNWDKSVSDDAYLLSLAAKRWPAEVKLA